MTGYQYTRLAADDLDLVAAAIAASPWSGYPSQNQRFFSHSPGFVVQGKVLQVPDGPWHISGHANRQGVPKELLDPEVPVDQPLMSEDKTARWREEGLLTDQLGRPVHPYWRQLLADKRIGLPTGVGMFYRYGPNLMVDAIVYRWRDSLPEFLLVKQRVTGKWGVPGGFVDPTDKSLEAAARREVAEETGLADLDGKAETILRRLPLRRRDTLNAWSEVALLVFHADQSYLHSSTPVAGDDAGEVGWYTREQMSELDMHDTHPPYLDLAQKFLRLT